MCCSALAVARHASSCMHKSMLFLEASKTSKHAVTVTFFVPRLACSWLCSYYWVQQVRLQKVSRFGSVRKGDPQERVTHKCLCGSFQTCSLGPHHYHHGVVMKIEPSEDGIAVGTIQHQPLHSRAASMKGPKHGPCFYLLHHFSLHAMGSQ